MGRIGILGKLIFFIGIILIDLYVFQAVKTASKKLNNKVRKIIFIAYWSLTVFSCSVLIAWAVIGVEHLPRAFILYGFGLVVVSFFAKLFTIIFLLIDDIIRVFRFIFRKINSIFSATDPTPGQEKITRIKFLSQTGLIMSALPFTSMIYGMIRGPFRFEVRKINLSFPNLPQAFDKIRILQISDIHSGSFLSTEPMQRLVNVVLEQKPDLIFFTGDLVNNMTSEVHEFVDIIKKIEAPMGVYSILGNHDYGDYVQWPTHEEKKANLDELKKVQNDLGWKLLLNENVLIEKDGESIGLVGVENWSRMLRFPKYGDTDKAVANMPSVPFKILLSHDPSHWKAEILKRFKDMDLTLSGHTHGFQFGVEIPNFKWSPVQYVYKEWAGLYQSGSQYLYVNRGAGFLGYPGRVGIMPEITVFELNRSLS